jgi:hypothetical protein
MTVSLPQVTDKLHTQVEAFRTEYNRMIMRYPDRFRVTGLSQEKMRDLFVEYLLIGKIREPGHTANTL